MGSRIGIVSGENSDNKVLCALLVRCGYQVACINSLDDLENMERDLSGLILDLDSLPLTDSSICDFNRINPNLPLLAVSSRTFHPQLKLSMSTCILACLTKPVNPDELMYLLKGILEKDQLPGREQATG